MEAFADITVMFLGIWASIWIIAFLWAGADYLFNRMDTENPKWQVRHNPLYKPKQMPDKKKQQSKKKCRKNPEDT